MNDSTPLLWPVAPAWSLFAGSLGKALILGAAALFVLSILGWAVAERFPRARGLGAWSFLGGGVALFGALGVLVTLFVKDQFQFDYVFARADANTALQYKIAGVWAGQEGSFLLWATSSAAFGILAARVAGGYRRWFTIAYSVFLAVLCGILAYESPFLLTLIDGKPLVPPAGNGLTPALQNYWVVIHPPTIFLGFGSLTVMFAFAVAAMIRREPTEWVSIVRPWSILGLTLLGLGLCMGGFWAYETLGWGGFWAWDPVENVSFVPWCLTAAFIHGIIVQVTRKKWVGSNLLLAGLPFISFVYGTFLTRSGLLTDVSVHSFAEMDGSARQILLLFLISVSILYFLLWLWRGLRLQPHVDEETKPGLTREATYRSASLLLVGMAVATAIGMSVPMFMALAGKTVRVVEEGLYHQVLVWLFVPIMLLMAAGPFISWRAMPFRELALRLVNIASLSIAIVGVSMFFLKQSAWVEYSDPEAAIPFPFGVQVPVAPWIMFLFWLCAFAMVANLWRMIEMGKRAGMSIGGFLSHFGVAMLMGGLILSRGFEVKSDLVTIPRGGTATQMGFTVKYKGRTITDEQSIEYLYNRDNKVEFEVSSDRDNFTARPGMFYVRTPEGQPPQQMVWPHIHRTLWHDVYFTLRGEATDAGPSQTLKPGETGTFDNMSVTYLGLDTEGEPGMGGTKFVANLKVVSPDGADETTIRPALELTPEGPRPVFGELGTDYFAVLHRMDASTKAVEIQFYYSKPWYPIEIFYKPMTILVWVGTGIMALGGLLAAWYRRRRLDHSAPTPPSSQDPLPENALEPVA